MISKTVFHIIQGMADTFLISVVLIPFPRCLFTQNHLLRPFPLPFLHNNFWLLVLPLHLLAGLDTRRKEDAGGHCTQLDALPSPQYRSEYLITPQHRNNAAMLNCLLHLFTLCPFLHHHSSSPTNNRNIASDSTQLHHIHHHYHT